MTIASRDQLKPMRIGEKLVVNYNKRYASNKSFYKTCTRTSFGKQSVSSILVDLCQDFPTSLKNLNTFTFPCEVK